MSCLYLSETKGMVKKMIKKIITLMLALSLVFLCVVHVKAKEVEEVEIKKFSQVIASDTNTLMLTEENELWGCGANYDLDTNPAGDDSNIIFPVKIAEDVLMVSKHEPPYTLFIKSDHTLWGYGENGYKRNYFFDGDNAQEYYRVPVKIMDDVKQVSIGTGHILVVKTDNTLWAWGNNSYKQLGYTSYSTVFKETKPKKVMDDVTYAAAGYSTSYVIKSDGSLWGFGANEYGEMGGISDSYAVLPTKIMDDIVKVDTSSAHVLAIDKDGNLYGWGVTTSSQVVDKNNKEVTEVRLVDFGRIRLPQIIVTKPIKIMDNVIDVCAGKNLSMAIKNDDTLWGWGAQPYGEFADSGQSLYSEPKKIMDNVKCVSSYFGHTAAIKNDGTLWTWGDNWLGELGTGVKGGSYDPTQIMIIPEPVVTKGDVNGDGTVDLSDVQLALKGALTIVYLNEEEKAAADVNENGIIDLDAVQKILKMALTII